MKTEKHTAEGCCVWECKFEPKKKGDKHEVDASHSR